MAKHHRPFAFRDWVRDRHLPYSIVAVKASIDSLVAQLHELLPIENYEPNVPLTGKLSDVQGIPVVKLKDNPWSVVYWSIGRSLLLNDDCRRLSWKLKTRAIHLTENHRSQVGEWFLYEDNQDLETAEWMAYNNRIYFESSLRKKIDFDRLQPDKIPAAGDRALDELLSEQGINIPGLDMDLAYTNIERVDMLTLPAFPLGMKDFQTWIYQGHPEYSIFAVKAPIEQVGQVLVDQCGVKEWRKQIQSDQNVWTVCYSEGDYWIPIIQPTANPWTIVYWFVGGWTELTQICKNCSSTLQTRVISLAEEDTSGGIGYTIYDQGENIERVEWAPGFDFWFESKNREEPEFDNFDESESNVVNEFINQTFIQEGIYIPYWEMNVSDPYLERVDMVLRS